MSSCHSEPVRNLCESTRATEHNMRCSSASFDISSENTATVFPSSNRGVLGDVHGERGLAHRRPRRNDDEVGFLQAAGHLVEIGVVRLESGDARPRCSSASIEPKESLMISCTPMKPRPNALLRKLEDLRFGVVENVFGEVALVGRACDGGGRGVNQPAQQRLVADNLDVVLNARPVRHAVEQSGNVGHSRRWLRAQRCRLNSSDSVIRSIARDDPPDRPSASKCGGASRAENLPASDARRPGCTKGCRAESRRESSAPPQYWREVRARIL